MRKSVPSVAWLWLLVLATGLTVHGQSTQPDFCPQIAKLVEHGRSEFGAIRGPFDYAIFDGDTRIYKSNLTLSGAKSCEVELEKSGKWSAFNCTWAYAKREESVAKSQAAAFADGLLACYPKLKVEQNVRGEFFAAMDPASGAFFLVEVREEADRRNNVELGFGLTFDKK